MIPFIIAGAIGFGIAKLLEKDDAEKFADGGSIRSKKRGDKITILGNTYEFLRIEMDNSKGYEEERVVLYDLSDKSMKSMPLDMVDAYSKYAEGGMIFKKGDKVILKDGGGQRMAIIVQDGFDNKNRVRVRPDGFPMDISVPMEEKYSDDKRVYVIRKMADGGGVDSDSYKKFGDDNLDLVNFDLSELDDYEEMQFNHALKSFSKAESLQVLINTIEGDYSQLSPILSKIAEAQYPSDEFFDDNRQYAGGGRIDKMDKFISELAKKNTKEFSVNEYHDFRNKKYAIGVARHYFTDNDGSFSKFDTKLGDALNIDFETQGDSTFITLGIDDLPQKYGVSEKWLDGKLKLINKPINNKTRNKLL